MAVMIIQMGEILRKAMRTVVATAMPPVIQLSRFWTAMRKTGAAIRATTAGRMPLKTAWTVGSFWKVVKTAATSSIIIKGGITLPRVATMLPFIPASRCPTKIGEPVSYENRHVYGYQSGG